MFIKNLRVVLVIFICYSVSGVNNLLHANNILSGTFEYDGGSSLLNTPSSLDSNIIEAAPRSNNINSGTETPENASIQSLSLTERIITRMRSFLYTAINTICDPNNLKLSATTFTLSAIIAEIFIITFLDSMRHDIDESMYDNHNDCSDRSLQLFNNFCNVSNVLFFDMSLSFFSFLVKLFDIGVICTPSQHIYGLSNLNRMRRAALKTIFLLGSSVLQLSSSMMRFVTLEQDNICGIIVHNLDNTNTTLSCDEAFKTINLSPELLNKAYITSLFTTSSLNLFCVLLPMGVILSPCFLYFEHMRYLEMSRARAEEGNND